MKTKLLSLFAAIAFSQAMMAQFHIGAKAGVNIIKIDGKSFNDQFRYGYHAGGFAEIGFGGRLGIQPEVLFSQYSTKIDSNFSFTPVWKPSFINKFQPEDFVSESSILLQLFYLQKDLPNYN